MKKLLLILALVLAAAFSSCSELPAENKPLEEAVYSGIFTVTYKSDGWGGGKHSGATTVVLSDGKYTCYVGNTDGIPAGGSGSYTVEEGKIIFNDENCWLAYFDWGLILNGEYDFAFNGKRLKISNGHDYATYEYDLVKQD